ncbi:Multidrug efflux pump subunit AcrA precursor [compost metagenome]
MNYRTVQLGPKVEGLRVIREGLKAGDRIVVNGLQRTRPGTQVSPEQVVMAGDEVLERLTRQASSNEQIPVARATGENEPAPDAPRG